MATTLDSKIKKVDNTSPMGGGTFILRELSIMSPSSPAVVHLNSPGVFEELNIYEDLFSNVLRGTFTFVDNQGLAELIPIIGDETLILSFSTPGAGSKEEMGESLESGTSSEEVFEQVFRVYDCIEDTTGEKAKYYKLFFVSQEYIVNTKSKISKGYNGRFYHQIVKDALKKINKKINPQWQKKVFIGPVYAAAVILKRKIDRKKLKDSKKLSKENREILEKYIKKNSIWAIGSASRIEIEKYNILNASLIAKIGRASCRERV